MNNKFLLFAISVLILFSCGKRLIEVEKKNDNGQIIEKYFLDKDSLKFGSYTSFDDQGNIFEESIYKKGVLNGLRTIYFSDGTEEVQEHYVDGEFHGAYKSYYENGQVNVQAEYIQGKMEGLVTRYYHTGEIMEEIQFSNNEENGPFKEYHKNGQVKWEGTYIDGDNEVGLVKGYDEAGELIKKMNCGKYNGEYICQTIWTLEEGEKELVLKYDE